ncbi:MAG: hypothetical protein GFH27_549289n299 [Chloroflexi bacterium AL-W]|nr:hypothetical protein [Chloroflexi bacterium AL-N1]NOK67031.1 hypothetical protein [Chloroflexi bacterium AL-N10]NOK74677.1 hypothetical protein [Chloroflexi bacterium AL-N5]NOK81633.1 hypothetical protein [Chloroflexi bacterium AL-W]NOK89103.1 hypothetical protein [Chloroflexi bacterium AL-N15]
MPPRKTTNDEQTVSRTYRAAIRIGEDFITLEETITLSVDASDEDITKAVGLGLRIYQTQREAIETQIATLREEAATPAPITVRDPESPASDKQRNFIANLQDGLGWTNERLATYANDQGIDLVTVTKGQASTFIDQLKKVAESRTAYNGSEQRDTNNHTNGSNGTQQHEESRVNDKQLRALERLADQNGLDLHNESQERFDVSIDEMTSSQAATLLREWQRSSTLPRTTDESLL